MDKMVYAFLLLLAYLVGSIPFGLLLGKAVGKDVRLEGSGNIGANNVHRLLGKKMGVLTLLADIGKAILPMIFARWLLNFLTTGNGAPEVWVALCGASAFLGHLFPIYLKFRGGKGVATALGVFLFLEPWSVLLSLGFFLAVLLVWGYVSLGSLIAAALLPVWIWLLSGSVFYTWLAIFIATCIWIKHSSNIARLLKGQEKSWKNRGDSPSITQ
jgi:glycerol-3-phosphate acyltransferase PlsY